ncbi:MAG: YgjV family protein [Clostridia bacterium]|nr:YgjV family protein [Clostridia bacterium]
MIEKIIIQAIGILAMAFNIWSYQQKKQTYVIGCQLFGSLLFSVHFFALGAYMGGLLNAIGIFRAVVFIFKDQFRSENILWLIGFEAVYLASYVLTFTLLKKEFNPLNAVVEILPIIGMTATTIAFRSKSSKTTRSLGLISSPSWLVYNIVSFSIGAICCEVLSLVSIAVGFFRLDKKEKEQQKQE